MRQVYYVIDLIFLFLEVHMPKIILIIASLLCVQDHCALYAPVVILLVLAFIFGFPVYMFSVYTISVFVSAVLLCRMIYQIEYIDHGRWNTTCEVDFLSKSQVA